MPPREAARPGHAELFAGLPVAAIAVDPGGLVRHANAAAEQLLNLSERQMSGQPLASLLSLPEGHGEGDAFAAYDVDIASGRGLRLRADLHGAAVPEHPGWRLLVFHPAARRGAAERGAGARAAVGAAAMLAHEIRNPLSGIRGAAQLLGPGELTSLIVSEVDRIAALIDRMEEFGDTRPLPVEAANIYPVLDHARSVALAGFARDVPVETRFDPSLPPACVNRDALTQVMLNLLRNAREAVRGIDAPRLLLATAYRPGLSVSAGPGGGRRALPIEISVVDNGPGAPPDIADHLFDPFVSGRTEGRGLGLALVDKLMRDMGGAVHYAREGDPVLTVFRLLLPRADG